MGLAAWGAFSFGFILPNGSYIIRIISDPFARGWDFFGTASFPWTPFLTGWLVPIQFTVLIIGFIFSADFAYKLCLQTFSDKKAAFRGFLVFLGCLALITLFFGWLYGG